MLTKVKISSKKAFCMLLALVMCLTAFSICLPVIADAITIGSYVKGRYYYYPDGTQFISSIRYGQAEKSADATSEATQGGYTKIDVDFNSGVSGKDYIFLGYKTSSNINDAMATYFTNAHSNLGDTAQITINGTAYAFTGTGLGTSGRQDLNADAGGDYIYLYASKDASLGLPVTAITAQAKGDSGAQPPSGYVAVKKTTSSAKESGEISDSNAGAGGNYVYLYFDNTSVYTDVSNAIFRLQDAIKTASTLGDQTCYTTATWNTFKAALDEANRINNIYNNAYNAGTVPSADILSAASALEKAMLGLETIIRIDAVTNGGTTSATMYTAVVADAKTVVFPASNYTATKEGYTFLGWNTDKNATSGSKTKLTVPIGATVYAIFSVNTFAVSFYNTVTKQTVKTENVNYNSSATAPEVEQILLNDANTHYEFKGWDKDFSKITATLTVRTVYETAAHTFEITESTAATCSATGLIVYSCSACGYTKTETLPIIPDEHKNISVYPQKASTCNVAGYTEYTYCNDCQTVISGKTALPLAEHTWGSWSASTATCTQAGTSTRKCSVCGATESKPTEAKGHTWGNWSTTKNATCTADGRKQRQCSTCRATETEIINALGHNYADVVTDATCTQKGYTTHTCSRCGDSYKDTYVDALGHDWRNNGNPTTAATCTTTGKQNQKCSRCSATQTATIEALGHNWTNQTITKQATCTTNGSMSATCDRCKTSQTNIVIPAYGHNWNEGVTTKQPTCTEDGNLHMTCQRCNTTKDVKLNALGHDWDNGEVKKVATCTQTGSVFYTCKRCGNTKTETIAKLPHDYKGVVTFPTCTEEGYTTYTCADCGNVTVDDREPALGHADIVTVVPPTCTLQGYTATRCLVCDKTSRSDYVPATGHIYKETVVAPTCTQKGYTLVACPTCSLSSKKDYTDALGHEYATTVVAPTCTQKGYDLHSCIRGDHAYKENYVNATGHKYTEIDRKDPTKTQSGYILYACDICRSETKDILYFNGKALIYATILDTNGNIVPEATVTIYSITTGKAFTIQTDLNGYFTEVLEEGDYEVLVTKIGYKDTVGYIYVSNNNKIVDIPPMPVVDDCDCYCHKSDFLSAIRRIFAKILKIFGTKHECCEYSEV